MSLNITQFYLFSVFDELIIYFATQILLLRKLNIKTKNNNFYLHTECINVILNLSFSHGIKILRGPHIIFFSIT